MKTAFRRILAASLLAPCGAFAAHPLITEDTGTQGYGGWELELNVEKTRDMDEGVRTTGLRPAGTLTYGAADRVDLQLTLSRLREKAQGEVLAGRLDTALDVKWRFYESGGLSLALKPGLTLPTGDEQRGLGTGRTTWGTLLILSYDAGPWAFHTHGGVQKNRNVVGERDTLRHLSGALQLNATPQAKLVVDVSRSTNPDRDSTSPLRQTVYGLIYSLAEDFDVDVGLRRGNAPASDRALLAGITYRW